MDALVAAEQPAHTGQRCDAGARTSVTYDCTYRVIWCTKYGRPALTGTETVLLPALAKAAAGLGAEILDLETSASTVEVLVRVSPITGVHKFVKTAKAETHRALTAAFPSLKRRLPSVWNSHYMVVTLGGEPSAESVTKFVASQRNA